MSPTPSTFKGMIKKPAGVDVQAKYTVEGSRVNPDTGVPTKSTFNINADAALPVFGTKGAPTEKTLDITFTESMQLIGFDTFSGSIGGGRIYIRTSKDVIIKGEIVGGPEDGQSFTGGGTWLSS